MAGQLDKTHEEMIEDSVESLTLSEIKKTIDRSANFLNNYE